MADANFYVGTAAGETLTGNDEGNILFGQGGKDTLIGNGGNDLIESGENPENDVARPDFQGDYLEGGSGNDQLKGGSGADLLYGGADTNYLVGGDGNDTAIYASMRADYSVSMFDGMPASITGPWLSDTLQGVERLRFSDVSVAFDIDGTAGDIYRLYRAAFDREPDDGGQGFWMAMADRGAETINSIADKFVNSEEFSIRYGSSVTDADFINQVYLNVLDRSADPDGAAYWLDVMQNHDQSRADVINFFAQSAENQAAVIGEIQSGIEFTLYTA